MKYPLLLPLCAIAFSALTFSNVMADEMVQANNELSGVVKGDEGTETFGGGFDAQSTGWNYFTAGKNGVGDNHLNSLFAVVLAFQVTPEWLKSYEAGGAVTFTFQTKPSVGTGAPSELQIFLLDVNDGTTTSGGNAVERAGAQGQGLGRAVANEAPLAASPVGSAEGADTKTVSIPVSDALRAAATQPAAENAFIWIGISAGTDNDGINEFTRISDASLQVGANKQ